MRVELPATAKVNWGLEVLARRPDGFHEIRTLTQTVSLADAVTVELAGEGIEVASSGQWEAPQGPGNICWRAAELFMQRFSRPSGARVSIRKLIPAGAGLGGGSADAVATLVGLAALCDVPREDLADLAAALGSDTVLFLAGGTADCRGRGEDVTPLPVTRTYHLVLARPDCAVSTPQAYGWLDPATFSDGALMGLLAQALIAGADPGDLAPLMDNVFTAPVVSHHWEIGALLQALREEGALVARMTGSGSACFGLVAGPDQAADLAVALCTRGYWAVAAHTTRRGIEPLAPVSPAVPETRP